MTHEHNWKIDRDQSDTGTNGVRKYCSKCHQKLTFYYPDDIKKLILRQKATPKSPSIIKSEEAQDDR